MDSATWVGSSGSNGRGRPVCVLQNLQERVQISPPIIKVAVPFPQHSPILGHRPLLQWYVVYENLQYVWSRYIERLPLCLF